MDSNTIIMDCLLQIKAILSSTEIERQKIINKYSGRYTPEAQKKLLAKYNCGDAKWDDKDELIFSAALVEALFLSGKKALASGVLLKNVKKAQSDFQNIYLNKITYRTDENRLQAIIKKIDTELDFLEEKQNILLKKSKLGNAVPTMANNRNLLFTPSTQLIATCAVAGFALAYGAFAYS